MFPDPWISIDDDRAKALRLEELVRHRSFADAVRTYWDMTPTTPRPQAERFINYVLAAEARSAEWLDWLARVESPAPDGIWIDLGCGTADLTAAGAERGTVIVGVDIALRWLVVAARREAVADKKRLLVCANAEYLPFPDASFARVLSLGMLEHCRDPDPVAAEARRILAEGGLIRLRTVNRYSLLGEPHVGVWGVGLMPRTWADAYVRWRTGQRYQHHRPLSPRELGRALRHAGFRDVHVEASAMLRADAERLGRAGDLAAPSYRALRSLPLIGRGIAWIAPVLDARAVR